MNKILYVTTASGFLPHFLMNDVAIIQDMGYEVHYASNFDVSVYDYDASILQKRGIKNHHIDILRTPYDIGKDLKVIRQLKQIIEDEDVDIVHCHNPVGGALARIAVAISKKNPKVIYTSHGLNFYKGSSKLSWLIYYPIEKLLAHVTDAIVTINKEDYDTIKNHFKLRDKDSFVEQIYGVGLNVDIFKPNKGIAMTKRCELGIPQDVFNIVTVAQLNDNKNQKIILEAISKLPQIDITYTICGEGPGLPSLEESIERLNLGDKVCLLGFRKDITDILQTADCFAFPSYREGLGMAAVEALSCGIPLIAADNRGTREYAIDGVNSIVCNPSCVDDFVEAIKKLYEDKEYRQMLASNCRQSVMKFSEQSEIEIMKSVYERVVD